MSTQTEALDRLIGAVEAGEDPNELAAAMPDQRTTDDLYRAFRGSLDAAKALHEALLPDWGWDLASDEASYVFLKSKADIIHDGDTGGAWLSPACAWLLAILRAYRGTLA